MQGSGAPAASLPVSLMASDEQQGPGGAGHQTLGLQILWNLSPLLFPCKLCRQAGKGSPGELVPWQEISLPGGIPFAFTAGRTEKRSYMWSLSSCCKSVEDEQSSCPFLSIQNISGQVRQGTFPSGFTAGGTLCSIPALGLG